tara:strand:+ start:782 stop:1201 length:420 start_codon:yes stop_codon:yes gene_type:complete
MIQKSKIEKIKEQDMWNDMHKFEIQFENGTQGMMFKKSPDPMCSVGDIVQYTQNEKGTIKIVKEGAEKYHIKNNDTSDDTIMLQCMFKAAATFYSNRPNASSDDVEKTANEWFDKAKIKLNGDTRSHQPVEKESTFVPF